VSSSKYRVAAYVTCSRCEERRKLSIHPNDTGSSIRIGCPECRYVSEHETGPPRWFK